MIRTIHLYGQLAEKTGVEVIELDANTPRQLISALRSQLPEFRTAMIDLPKTAIVLSNKDKSQVEPLTPDTFEFPLADLDHIHIFAETEGAGIEAYLVASFISWGMSTAIATVLGSVVFNLAVSFVMGAISRALAPSPDTSDGGGRPEERPSFLFNGAVNVVEQGYPVPLVYGTHTTGSIVISAGVDVAELPYGSTQSTPPANGGGSTQPSIPPVETWQWGQ